MPVLGVLYGLIVGGLLSLAGGIVQHMCAHKQIAQRWVWFGSLVTTVGAAGLFTLLASRGPAGDEGLLNFPAHLNSARALFPAPILRLIGVCWMVWSLLFLATFLRDWVRVTAASHSWRRTVLDSNDVYVSENTGPGAFGHIRPGIVLPRWLVDDSGPLLSMALEHERQHIQGRDPLLLLCATLLAAVMPWNVFVIFQLQQLRFAIEADCDVRVISAPGGPAIPHYTAALKSLLSREQGLQTKLWMRASVSQLERRIRLLTRV